MDMGLRSGALVIRCGRGCLDSLSRSPSCAWGLGVVMDANLERALRRLDTMTINVWVELTASDPAAVTREVERWVQSPAGSRDPRYATKLGPVLVPGGKVRAGLSGVADDDLVGLFGGLLEALGAAGLDVEAALPRDLDPDVEIPHGVTAVWVGLPWLPEAADWFDERRRSTPGAGFLTRTDLDQGKWQGLVEQLLAWCAEMGEDTRWYVLDRGRMQGLDRDSGVEVTRLAMRTWAPRVLTYVKAASGAPRALRAVAYNTDGYGVVLSFGHGDRPRTTEERLSVVRQLLGRLSPYIVSAFALDISSPRSNAPDLLGRNWPRTGAVRTTAMPRLALLEDRLLIDAFGLVYLGAGFDGRAQTPAHYTVEPLGPGRLLVHKQPKAWFGPEHGRLPNEDLLTQARSDLADVLATADDLEAQNERLWGPRVRRGER